MAAEPRTRPASGEPSANGRSVCAPTNVACNGAVLRTVPSTDAEAASAGARWLQSVVAKFEGGLVRYAARIIGDLDRGRDVAQETFLRLCREASIAESDHLAQWLFTVCRRLALDVRRKETRMNTGDAAAVCDLPSPSATLSSMEQTEDVDQVLRLLDALPTNQQEVVRLKFQEGMAYKQIAEITGLSVTNVGYLLHTAVKTLRERMSPNE